jgi:hypothetical protein
MTSTFPPHAVRLAALALTALAACAPAPPADPTQAVERADLTSCRGAGPPGDAHVTVVFGASGEALSAIVDGGPWIGTPTARCIEERLRAQRVKPFDGPSRRVARTLHLR